MEKTKFVCNSCGKETHIETKEVSLEAFKDPECCGKKMFIAS